MIRRAIVTGGAGFVGSQLVWQLQRQVPDVQIVVIDDMRCGTFSNLVEDPFGKAGPFKGTVIAKPLAAVDIRDIAARFEPEVIFHEAAITDTTVTDEATMINDNADSFDTLIDVAQSVGSRLVWASSAATYGIEAGGATVAHRPFVCRDAGYPANVYGFSKWLMENQHRRAVADHRDFHMVGLRYFNVFGPSEAHKGKMASMVYKLAMQMLDGQQPRIFFDGTQARDQVYVKDVVAATIAAAADDAQAGIYNVGSGVATSFNQVVEQLNTALGTDLSADYFDNPYSFYQAYTCADLDETRSGLGWEPSYSPEDAIVEYAHWIRGQREDSKRSLSEMKI